MGTTQFFSRFNSVSEVVIRLNSWLTMDLQELTQISSRLKIDFWNVIQIDSRLKKSGIFWFKLSHDSKQNSRNFVQIDSWPKKTIWNIDGIKSWLNDSNQLLISLTFFGLSYKFISPFWSFTKFRWPFLAFHQISLTFFWAFDSSALIRISSWLKHYLEDLNRFNWWLKRLSRNWLKINSWLK